MICWFFKRLIKLKNNISFVKCASGLPKDLFFCRLPNGIIYKITSDANDEQKWI
jgi:hypothetical protein